MKVIFEEWDGKTYNSRTIETEKTVFLDTSNHARIQEHDSCMMVYVLSLDAVTITPRDNTITIKYDNTRKEYR